jgi:pyruvyl transferase EpsO
MTTEAGHGFTRDLGMQELILKHDDIAALIPRDRPVAFMDYPIGLNVGDHLIMMGTLKFFERHGYRRRLSRNLHNTERKGRLGIQPGDTIVLQGGGNFGDLYPHIQDYRERIVAEYPENKIVMMPQTIFFKDQEKLGRAADLLNRHSDLTLIVRDRVSYDLCKPLFGERLLLSPDMAHELWPSLRRRLGPDKAAAGPLFFMRKDEEEGASFESLSRARDRFVDWEDQVTFGFRLKKRLYLELSRLQGRFNVVVTPEDFQFRQISDGVLGITRALDAHTPWITSRLHGFILGLLLDKPVAAVDNSYGKLSSYIETWRPWIEPALLIRSEKEAREMTELALSAPSLPSDVLRGRYAALAGGSRG